MKQKQYHSIKARLLVLTGLILFAAGSYALILTFSPQISFIDSPYRAKSFTAGSEAVKSDENYIYIEKLGLAVPFSPGGQEMLEQGAWHRFPERGDPAKGGNFILSAHRFQMGITPKRTKRKSPFYHIDKLTLGDRVDVAYEGKKYSYQISRVYSVEPGATEIEAPSNTSKLTLYTCTLKGSADGRVVIEAKPLPI